VAGIFDTLDRGLQLGVDWSRRHSRIADRFWAAGRRYNEHHAGRLAAAVAYYGFFAAFALALVGYSILGYLMSANATLVQDVTSFLDKYLPGMDAGDIQRNRNAVAVIGLIGLVLTGVGWVEAMRSSQRAIWRLEQQPGDWVIRVLIDLGMLVGLGLLLALSLWATGGLRDLLLRSWLQNPPKALPGNIEGLFRWAGQCVSLLLNFVIASALLCAVPRLRVSPRRFVPSALLVAVGLQVLTSVNGLIVERIQRNPALIAVGSVASLLLSIYLFNQLLMFGAALAATSQHGRVIDLAAGPLTPTDLAEMASVAQAQAGSAAMVAGRLQADVETTAVQVSAGCLPRSELALLRMRARDARVEAARKAQDAVDLAFRAARARDDAGQRPPAR